MAFFIGDQGVIYNEFLGCISGDREEGFGSY
jgi:hypothetical protein